MRLVPVSIESIQIGKPLAFSLRDDAGLLLASKGYVIASRDELQDWVSRGTTFYVDEEESELHNKAFIGKLIHMVHTGSAIGEIANTRISQALPVHASDEETEEHGPLDWMDLQVQANAILRKAHAPEFLTKLLHLNRRLIRLSHNTPDSALFALLYLSSSETKLYSATHAMLVSVMCVMAARDVLGWPQDEISTLGLAALTMNTGMIELQDQLASQLASLRADQIAALDTHAQRSVDLLQQAGVTNTVWLQAVLCHHDELSGPLSDRTAGRRMACLIQRADTISARLAPRASRKPLLSIAAMKASYFDANKQVDEAGAALIKAIGIYSPGSFVRIQTQEVAVVVRRGVNTATPKVAVLINREGLPMVEPVVRDTALAEYKIVASVPFDDIKLKLNLPRILGLTVGQNEHH
jgi:hypothetical protein